jgi:hypothetical protein
MHSHIIGKNTKFKKKMQKIAIFFFFKRSLKMDSVLNAEKNQDTKEVGFAKYRPVWREEIGRRQCAGGAAAQRHHNPSEAEE